MTTRPSSLQRPSTRPPDGENRRDLHLALGKIHDDRGDWDTAFMHFDEANRPFAEIARTDADTSLAMMDQVRTFYDSDWFAERAAASEVDPTPVFIVGMPRSGTSLVEQFLAAHPAVHGAGELSEIGHMVAKIASARHCLGPLSRLHATRWTLKPSSALGRRYVAHLRTLFARARPALPTSSRGTTCTSASSRPFSLARRIVHCRRDPLDTAISLYFNDFMFGHDYSNDLHAIGRQIRGMRALMAHWEAVLGDRILTVDYEALVADPEPLARRIVRHVDLAWDDACLHPHEVERPVRTASMWQVRQPVYRRSAGRARRYERFLGPLREALGESPAG